jgi:hypothetical protein
VARNAVSCGEEERVMEHRHEYEAVYHPNPSAAAKTIGIKAAEMRKCKTCQKEMPFVMIRDHWVPLFEDTESGDQGILLA